LTHEKNHDTATITQAALSATGLRRQPMAKLIHVGLRTLDAWLSGEKRPPRIAVMVLNEVTDGWRPGREDPK